MLIHDYAFARINVNAMANALNGLGFSAACRAYPTTGKMRGTTLYKLAVTGTIDWLGSLIVGNFRTPSSGNIVLRCTMHVQYIRHSILAPDAAIDAAWRLGGPDAVLAMSDPGLCRPTEAEVFFRRLLHAWKSCDAPASDGSFDFSTDIYPR